MIKLGKPTVMWAVTNSIGDVFIDTISYTRKDAIKEFCKDVTGDWAFWRKEYDIRCIKISVLVNSVEHIA